MGKKLQLYLHIPFCVKKCDYCDFLSFPVEEDKEECRERETLSEESSVNPSLMFGQIFSVNEKLREQYIKALVGEIQSAKDRFKDYKVNTIFMGGGTPSILSCKEVNEIFSALRKSFVIDKDAEITIEANPGTVTKEKLATWKEIGINRVSIGLQSAKDEELKLLGRIHTYKQFKETFSFLRENGFSNINVDLISGVPGQTMESYMETLHKVIELNPEHISAYGLMIEEGTKFWEVYEGGDRRDNHEDGRGFGKCCSLKDGTNPMKDWYPNLPSEEVERQMYKTTRMQLEQYGYHRYEISNYAKEGFECKHNLGYWERVDYLGIGLGAASLIGNVRFHQVEDLGEYVKMFAFAKESPPEDIMILNEKEQMEEFMFLGLRKTKGISKTQFYEKFERSIDGVYGRVLMELERESLIEINDDKIKLTEKGIDISNVVFAEFIF